MSHTVLITLVTFVAASSLLLLTAVLFTGRNRRMEARLLDISGKAKDVSSTSAVSEFARTTLPKIGSALSPVSDKERTRLNSSLLHAGFYDRHAMAIYLGIKMILMIIPVIIGLVAGLAQTVDFQTGIVYGLLGTVFGMIGPSFWLGSRKKKRQAVFRRSLPDALDMIVICLEGGLSLQGAFQRVTAYLGKVHPELALEMNINLREIQMGRSTGEALRQFADRTDLEEVRSLAAVVQQTERLGGSASKALRIHSDTLRQKRLDRAEELAQIAGTKILFPTILFIFPAILLVVMGPAVMRLMKILTKMQ